MAFDKFFHGNDMKDDTCNTDTLPILINKPIDNESDDAVGLLSDAKMLSNAIDKKADMIAVASPFGSGKSSVIELLRNLRKNVNGERIITISMWPQLSGDNTMNTNELHKHLTYQIIKAIDSRIGSYVNRRNSSYFKIIKAYSNHKYTFVFAGICILLWLLSDTKQLEYLFDLAFHLYPGWAVSIISVLAKILVVFLGLFILKGTEIVISNPKYEEKREVEEDEIIDVFREEALKKHICKKRVKAYIVVIEDLDRCEQHDFVYQFLKELRKYYIPDESIQEGRRDRIVFIVNIKPEGMLKLEKNSNTDIYEKVFDYILDLQTIHTDDYKTVFNEILNPYKEKLVELGIVPNANVNSLIDVRGIQWIINGKHLQIREIKHRFNRALNIYVSLKNRFPEKENNISFEKCAVVAYLTTAYDKDFIYTDENVFGQLVLQKMEKDISRDECEKIIKNSNSEHLFSEDYIDEVWELIRSRIIDSEYRMYLFNYPKGSVVDTYDDNLVRNAIRYDENSDSFNEVINKAAHKLVIKEALEDRLQLGKELPRIIFDNETLYCECIRLYPKETVSAMGFWVTDFSNSGSIITKIMQILRFDRERKQKIKEIAEGYCKEWNAKLKEEDILALRLQLCKEFPEEILYYKDLFFEPHALITVDESNSLSLTNAIELFNMQRPDATINRIGDLVKKYKSNTNKDETERMLAFLQTANKKYQSSETADVFMEFMEKSQCIDDELEKSVFTSFGRRPGENSKYKVYQHLINSIAHIQEISKQSIKNICDGGKFDGFSSEVGEQLYNSGKILESILVKTNNNDPIRFENNDVRQTIKNSIQILKDYGVFESLRIRIVKECDTENIMLYRFMFDKEQPIMSEVEIKYAQNKLTVEQLLSLWPVEIVTEESCDNFVNYWNLAFRLNATAENILVYISKLEPSLAEYCFQNIDFMDKLKYHSFSEKRRIKTQKALSDILQLDKAEKMLSFIKHTHYMDEDWLEKNQGQIIQSEELESAFVSAVNSSVEKAIGDISINTIESCKRYHAYKEKIEKKLFERNSYEIYVTSTILRKKKFEMENTSTTSEMWKVYVNLYKKCTRYIFEYMSMNKQFIELMMKAESYKGLDDKHRNPFRTVKQTKESLEDLFKNYTEEFVIKYLSEIEGYEGDKAEQQFIDIMKTNQVYLMNKSIYNNTYNKLSKNSKRIYTILRKKKNKTGL